MRSANSILSIVIVTVIVLAVNPVWAHFGMIIPSYSMVMQKDNRNVDLVLSFSHPFEGQWNGTGKARSFRSFGEW